MRRIAVFRALVALLLPACVAPSRTAFLPDEPLARHGHSAAIVGNTLYVLGGFVQGKEREPDRGGRDVCAIDLATGAWEARAPLPRPLAAGAACVVDGELFAVGGGIVARYDSRFDHWTAITAVEAIPNSHLSAAAFEGSIIVAGGFPFRDSPLLRVSVKDGSVEAMTPPQNVAKGDHFLFCVVLGDRLHVLGGIRESDVFDRHESFAGGVWRQEPRLPVAASTKFAAYGVVDDVLYVWDGGGLAHAYDPSVREWTAVGPWPECLVMPACVAIGDEIHVLGGMPIRDESGEVRRPFDRPFDTEARVWKAVPAPRT